MVNLCDFFAPQRLTVRRWFPSLVLVGVSCGAALDGKGAAAQSAFTFAKIVELQTNEPAFSSAVVNASGTVAYRRNTNVDRGIYVSKNGLTTRIADTTGFTDFGFLDLNDAGTVVFSADISGGGEGIFIGDGGPTTPIATTSTPSPLGGLFTEFGSNPSINSSGRVAFMGRAGSRRGIFTSDGAISTVVDDGGPLQNFDIDATINDSGLVGFGAEHDSVPFVLTAFTSAGGGNFTEVVTSDHIVTASSLTNSGDLLVHIAGANGDTLLIGSGGPFEVVIDQSRGLTINDHPAINNIGHVVYEILDDAQGLLTPGIYTGPSAQKVIRQGDPLFGSTVNEFHVQGDLDISSYSVNDGGQIAFTYVLLDGRRGVALATPVPEPMTLFLLATLLIGGSSRLRSRGEVTTISMCASAERTPQGD